MDVEAPVCAKQSSKISVKKEPEDENDIKDFAETTMNELLGWYGYDKVDSRDTQGLNLNRFTGSSKDKDGGCNSGSFNKNSIDHLSINGGTESSSSLDSPTGGSSGGGNGNGSGGPASCHSPTPSQSQTSPNTLSNGYVVCAWCQKIGMKLFTLRTNNGMKAFCSEICFTQCRRASFKKYKVCDWCKHIRHTVNYVDFQDGEQQLQFCSDKCLNQYKMNIFCRETQAHLQMHPHLRDASKLSGTCTSSTSGNRNLTLITPELWLRDCKERDAINGHSDGHISGAESEDKSDASGTSTMDIITAPRSKRPETANGTRISTNTECCEGKENVTRPSGEGESASRRHNSRLRERERRRNVRHQAKRGGTHTPLLHHHHHHRHNNHIRQVLEKLDKPDKHKSNHSSPRFSLPRSTEPTTTSKLLNGSSTPGLSGGSPTSISSPNLPPHPNLIIPPPAPPPPLPPNDILRAPLPPGLPPQPLLFPHQPSDFRLPPPFSQGIRPPMPPFCLPPGIQLPPSLQPFFSNLSQFGLSGGPSAIHQTQPTPAAAGTSNPPTSLLPPVTVMVPYPVILPIPIPIPIPLPFLRNFKMSDLERHLASPDGRVEEPSNPSTRPNSLLPPHLQRTLHQNSTKRVDSVITRLVNSKMSQIHNSPSTNSATNELSGSSVPTMTSTLRLKEEPREESPSLSEIEDRPSVHSLAGSSYSNSNYAPNPFTESAEEEDSFGCPDSEGGHTSEDSFSTCHSESRKEFENAICDGLSIPSSPTSRLRHQLVSMIPSDEEPHTKRKCLRTRLLAK